jgi:DNA-binding transcriptional ArsR family regulator
MPTHPYYITSRKQLLALASPGREDIIDAVELIGPCGVTEIARFLGRPRNALYYHVRVLRDVGLLLETTVSGAGTKPFAQYDVPGRPVILRYDLSSERSRRAVARVGRSRFRRGERGFLRACRKDLAVVEGPRRNLWVVHLKGWLSPRDLEAANEHFHKLVEIFRQGADAATEERAAYDLTFGIAPVVSGKRKP